MKRYRLKKDLPTFKAGEIFVLWDTIEGPGLFREADGIMAYHRKTLDKFPNILEEWFEEIRPVGPLIKDEKVRKAVRAWAEACNIERVYFRLDTEEGSTFCIYNFSIDCYFMQVATHDQNPIEGERVYTIAELCGEEEE